MAAVSFALCRIMELALIPERRDLCFWFQFAKRGGNLMHQRDIGPASARCVNRETVEDLQRAMADLGDAA